MSGHSMLLSTLVAYFLGNVSKDKWVIREREGAIAISREGEANIPEWGTIRAEQDF